MRSLHSPHRVAAVPPSAPAQRRDPRPHRDDLGDDGQQDTGADILNVPSAHAR